MLAATHRGVKHAAPSGELQRGGIINLVYAGDETRFEINLDAAQHARLHISSRLLSLARIIRDRDAGRE